MSNNFNLFDQISEVIEETKQEFQEYSDSSQIEDMLPGLNKQYKMRASSTPKRQEPRPSKKTWGRF